MLSSCWKRTITTAPRAGPQMLPSPPRTTIRTKKPFALKSIVVGLISWLTKHVQDARDPGEEMTAMTQAR